MDAAQPSRSIETVRIAGHRHVAYAEYGDPAGRPVPFLHGTPGSHRLYRLFADAARRHGVRLLAPDRPDYGDSSPWPERDLTDTGAFVATHGDRVASVDIVAGATPPSGPPPTPPAQRLLGRLASTTRAT